MQLEYVPIKACYLLWGKRGGREQLTGFCWALSSAGLQSLWLRSCSTAWHFGSKDLAPPQTKRKGTTENGNHCLKWAKWDWVTHRNSRCCYRVQPPHLPTSLKTLSSFVAFIINSGYPTMLYIASACEGQEEKKEWKAQAYSRWQCCVSLSLNCGGWSHPWWYGLLIKIIRTFSFAAFFVSESIQLTSFKLSSNAHLISATISSAWSTDLDKYETPTPVTQQHEVLHEALTMALLSSAKVSLTNRAPRAKPKALSVSLTHSFQRGVQLYKNNKTHWGIKLFYIT